MKPQGRITVWRHGEQNCLLSFHVERTDMARGQRILESQSQYFFQFTATPFTEVFWSHIRRLIFRVVPPHEAVPQRSTKTCPICHFDYRVQLAQCPVCHPIEVPNRESE